MFVLFFNEGDYILASFTAFLLFSFQHGGLVFLKSQKQSKTFFFFYTLDLCLLEGLILQNVK